MRSAIAVFMSLAVLAASAEAAPRSPAKKKIELYTREAVLAWIGDYRGAPDPARVPAAVKALSQLGALKDPEGSGVFVGFLAGVIASNPATAERLINKALPLPAEHQWMMVRAIAYSGLPEWKALLARVAARLPARKVMIEKYLAGQLPTLDQMPVDKDSTFVERVQSQLTFTRYFAKEKPKEVALEPTSDVLDTLWGYYFATGANSRIGRIIAMLPWSKDRDSADKVMLGNMAKYTLAINAARDPEVLAALKRAAPQQPKSVAPILAEVIDAAETADTARLRRESLASIEQISAQLAL